MAMLDTKEYESWEHYFRDKLGHGQLLVDAGAGDNIIHVRSRSLDCETRLVIEFPGEETCMVTCFNGESLLTAYMKQPNILSNTLFESYYEFNDISLDQLDNQLNIPLYFGWTEDLVFYRTRLVEAQLRFNDGVRWNALPVEKNRTWLDKAGCLLTLFTWPVLYVQHQFVLFMYRKKMRKLENKDVRVEAMIPKHD